MAKIQIKSEKLAFAMRNFSIKRRQFDALLAQTIDSTLGLRCTMFGYQAKEDKQNSNMTWQKYK